MVLRNMEEVVIRLEYQAGAATPAIVDNAPGEFHVRYGDSLNQDDVGVAHSKIPGRPDGQPHRVRERRMGQGLNDADISTGLNLTGGIARHGRGDYNGPG